MSSEFLRLAVAPGLNHPGNPSCDACEVETRFDRDGWMCDSCGTTWPPDDMEASGDAATLYSDWSGEDLIGPICPNDDAWRFAHLPPGERDARIRDHLEATSSEPTPRSGRTGHRRSPRMITIPCTKDHQQSPFGSGRGLRGRHCAGPHRSDRRSQPVNIISAPPWADREGLLLSLRVSHQHRAAFA